MNDDVTVGQGTLIMLILLAIIISVGFGGCAAYGKFNVWYSSLEGEAELKKAEWNRQIVVREAQAKKDSALLLAEAEIERAKGVAKANEIIGTSLKNNEDYLRYLWIDHINTTQNQIIYVPTEASLPILEAGRRAK